MKVCSGCAERKPREDFHRKSSRKDGLQSYCKPCSAEAQRARILARNYGLTLEQYQAMLDDQGGHCASCNDDLTWIRAAAVDHCHATGRVRGLLCTNCNIALGHLRDDPDRILGLLRYLETA